MMKSWYALLALLGCCCQERPERWSCREAGSTVVALGEGRYSVARLPYIVFREPVGSVLIAIDEESGAESFVAGVHIPRSVDPRGVGLTQLTAGEVSAVGKVVPRRGLGRGAADDPSEEATGGEGNDDLLLLAFELIPPAAKDSPHAPRSLMVSRCGGGRTLLGDATDLYFQNCAGLFRLSKRELAVVRLDGAESLSALDDDYIYSCERDTLTRRPKAWGEATVLAEDVCSSGLTVLHGEHAYTVQQKKDQYTLVEVPKVGGAVRTLLSAESHGFAHLAVDDTHVYFVQGHHKWTPSSRVYRVSKDGGAPERLADGYNVEGLSRWGDRLFWRAFVNGAPLVSMPAAGGEVQVLATPQDGSVATGLSVASSGVYWNSRGGALVRSELEGKTSELLYQGGLIEGSPHVDETHVYFTESVCDDGKCAEVLRRVPR